jgi:hypothetical protein
LHASLCWYSPRKLHYGLLKLRQCSHRSGVWPSPSVFCGFCELLFALAGWIQTSIRLCQRRRASSPWSKCFQDPLHTAVGALSLSSSLTQPALSLYSALARSAAVGVCVCDDMLSLTAARMKNNAPLCESQLIWWMAGYMHFAALTHSAPAGLMQMDPHSSRDKFMELNTENATRKRVPLTFSKMMRYYLYVFKTICCQMRYWFRMYETTVWQSLVFIYFKCDNTHLTHFSF